MNPPAPKPAPAARPGPAILPPPKWWGKYVLVGEPPQRRFVLRWGRILVACGALGLAGYLTIVTALWSYYAFNRKIPGVHWVDVAILPRFSRVQEAIGAAYYADAQAAWRKKDYVRAMFTARAAVQKAPANLDVRLFLADCWRQLGRSAEAVRMLRDGIPYNAADPRLQQAAVGTCMDTGRFQDALQMLEKDFPAHGVRLLDGKNLSYVLAEVRAAVESEDATQAAKIAAGHPELSTLPQAAPLLARIDLELGHGPAALERLNAALNRAPTDAGILGSYIATAEQLGRTEDAKAGARHFLSLYPNLGDAHLAFLEAYGSREGADRQPWIGECMNFLRINRHSPEALAHLASVAAAHGWTDLTFLLYENSLQESLTGLPFGVFYAASLVKTGEMSAADAVWRELAARNGPQLASAAFVQAMVAWGMGRRSEALEIVNRLHRDTADDPARRRALESLFRTFGFPKIADELAANRA